MSRLAATRKQKQASLEERLSELMITVAIVVHNDEKIIKAAIREIQSELLKWCRYYEILIIENASVDNSQDAIRRLQRKLSNIRMLILSRTYSSETALAAALENSIGDYIILLDPRADPPKLIPRLLEEAFKGYDIVIAKSRQSLHKNPFTRFLSQKFYQFLSWLSGFELSANATYFRVLSRRAVNSIIKIKSKARYFKYFNALIGFKQTYIEYDPSLRLNARPPLISFWQSLFTGLELLIANSSFPLRLASLIGLTASLASTGFLVYVMIVNMIKDRIIEGWVTSSLVTGALFLFLFLILTILAEYVARVLNETKDQPLYFVSDEYNSEKIETNEQRLNVI